PASYAFTGKISIDHVTADFNTNGIILSGAVTATGEITNSSARQNLTQGVYVKGFFGFAIDSLIPTGNQYGLYNDGGSSVLLGRSLIASNANGVYPAAGTIYSYQNNFINNNGIDLVNPISTTPQR